MNIDRIKYFVEISKEGSITATAKKNNISQTALTQQMNELEKELNVKLLERTKVGTTLTEKGKIFLEKAKVLLHDYDELLESVKERDDGKITVAYTGPLEQQLLLKAIPEFHNHYSNISIELKQFPMNEMKTALKENKCDIALVIPGEITKDTFYHVIVAEREIMAAISKENKQIRNKLVRINELNHYNVILLKDSSSVNASETVRNWCIQNGWSEDKILYADTIENQILMAILNQGITLLPKGDYAGGIRLISLKDKMNPHKTEAVFAKKSNLIQEMVECLQKKNS